MDLRNSHGLQVDRASISLPHPSRVTVVAWNVRNVVILIVAAMLEHRLRRAQAAAVESGDTG